VWTAHGAIAPCAAWSVPGYNREVDVESAALIGLLATALFSTIGLLATALFQLRGRIDALGSEIADVRRDIAGVRADLARIEVRLDAHLQEAHG
jgi:hypothetical protein